MLTTNEIKNQMHLGNIMIKNTSEKSFHKPNSVDVHLGNTLYVYDEQNLDARKSSEYLKDLMSNNPVHLKKIIIPETGLLLEPYKLYLSKTIEEIEVHNFIPELHGKASMALLGVGINLNNGRKWDGYEGALPLSIIATKPTIIYPDIPIGNLVFFPSLNNPYEIRKTNGIEYGAYSSGMLSGQEISSRMQGDCPDIDINDCSKIKINPNSVNLTLNHTIGVYTEKVLDIKKENPYRKIDITNGEWLYPDEVYLARTNEWTAINNLVPMLSGRSSLGRLGIHVHCSAGMGSIGYEGFWRLSMRATIPVQVIGNMQCCQLYFYRTEGIIGEPYHGNFQRAQESELGSPMYRILKK